MLDAVRAARPEMTIAPALGWVLLTLLPALLSMDRAQAAEAGSEIHAPRNVLHADLLARVAGEPVLGIYYERARLPGGKPALVLGASFAKDLTMGTRGGADVSEVESDLFGVGAQWRRYHGRAPRGPYFLMALSIVGGEATGKDSDERRRAYTLAGYDVTILGFGFQQLMLDRFSLEAAASLHTSLGWLWERDGGDHGTAGGFGVGVSGGLGLAF
jgi:hypothetical protein